MTKQNCIIFPYIFKMVKKKATPCVNFFGDEFWKSVELLVDGGINMTLPVFGSVKFLKNGLFESLGADGWVSRGKKLDKEIKAFHFKIMADHFAHQPAFNYSGQTMSDRGVPLTRTYEMKDDGGVGLKVITYMNSHPIDALKGRLAIIIDRDALLLNNVNRNLGGVLNPDVRSRVAKFL